MVTGSAKAPSSPTSIQSDEQQARLFEAITSTTPDFVFVYDLQGRFVYVNRRLLEVWGMELENVVGKTCLELGYEQWLHDKHMDEIAEVIQTRKSIKGEVPFTAPRTGIFGVYEYIFSPFLGAHGTVELIVGTTRDVTDRKRIEEALREREARYRELFNSINQGFCVMEKTQTADGRLDFLHAETNPAVAVQSAFGEIAGKTLRDLLPTAEAEEWIDFYATVLRTGEAQRFERELRSVGRTFEVNAYRLGDGSKQQVGVLFVDITARRQTEQQLQRNNDTFYHLIQNNPFGNYVVDADFKLRQVSLGAQKVFENISPLIGRDFAEVLRSIWTEPFATQVIDLFRHTLRTGEPYSSPRTIEPRQNIGSVEAYDWRIERLMLPDGRYGVVCYFYDLSERQRWEAALRLSEERFQLAARATNDAIWDWDFETKEIWWNEGMHTLFGYPLGEKISRIEWWQEQLHPEDHDRIAADLQKVIDNGETFWRSEYRFRRADGTYADVFDRGYVMRNAGGSAVRMLGAMQDLTERKKAEAALSRAQEVLRRHAVDLEKLVTERTAKLREMIAELETLSYSISHDMRAPLRAMQGFSQALLEDHRAQLDAQGISYLERISGAAERLDTLIQDILLYTSVGRERLLLEPIELEPLVREVLQTYHPDKESCVKISGPFPKVLGHAAFLSQIFSNLITNALKFVAPGRAPEVEIRCDVEGDMVKIWVADNGIGIAPQHVAGIFQVFGRVHSEAEYPGTGIGLAIVKRAAQRMGGDVGVQSELNRGSRFWFTLKKA
ncbi:MAG TPA: PAS domain S-box protein [Candidatus Kapabacteria bacterium]|nr:PAS domain S-box protein [Candidatus Kapabacteria bacterium]